VLFLVAPLRGTGDVAFRFGPGDPRFARGVAVPAGGRVLFVPVGLFIPRGLFVPRGLFAPKVKSVDLLADT